MRANFYRNTPSQVLITMLLCVCLIPADVRADEVPTSNSDKSPSFVTQPISVRVREHQDLAVLQQLAQQATKRAVEATVSVQVGRGRSGGFAFGSGVLVSADGFVLTAAHVSNRPNEKVIFRFADGRSAKGITLGLNKELDMGLMKITDPDGPWPFLKRAPSSKVKPGDWVLATGHPGGFDDTFPAVARLGRILKTTPKVLLTDCTLVGGDSGGPLVDINGNLVGIHSRIGADLTTNLHVPIDRFAESWSRLARKDVWGLLVTTRPWIGVEHNVTTDAPRIREVRSDSPAALAGLMPGDTVVRFAGKALQTFDELKQLVARQSPGTKVAIQYNRGGTLYETMLNVGTKKTAADSQTRDDAALLKDWLREIDLRRRRGMAVTGIGKNADQVKESFHDVLVTASTATVQVIDDGTVIAFGTIVDEHLILTKASELRGRNLRCQYRNTRSFPVELVSELRSHDLALLKSRRPLPSVSMRSADLPAPGTLLASSGLNVWPVAVGMVSRGAAEIPSEGKLGIQMTGDLPQIAGILSGSGADIAGLQMGDMITIVNSRAIKTAQELIDIVSRSYPGDILQLVINRNGDLQEYAVELVRYSQFDEALADFEDFIGGSLSERRTGFPRVIQHDTAIRPLHCGGPVVDIEGRFVGINIARAARTSSYLLPASEVKIALELLQAKRTDKLVTVDIGANK